MMIANGDDGTGDKLLILGLSHENVWRLVNEGEPLMISRRSHGDGIPDGIQIVIIVGPKESDIVDALKAGGLITDLTQTFKDTRL